MRLIADNAAALRVSGKLQLTVTWKEERKAHHNDIGQHEDPQGKFEMPVPSAIMVRLLFEFVDDFLVAVFHDKDIVKQHGGKAIDRNGENDRLEPVIETVMLYKMKIK